MKRLRGCGGRSRPSRLVLAVIDPYTRFDDQRLPWLALLFNRDGPMRTKTLGKTTLQLPVISFGAYSLGGGYWGVIDRAACNRAIDAALDVGMNAFDTAPVYGFGQSEELLGEALRGRRDRAIVMTKVGVRWDGEGDYPYEMPDPNGKPVKVRFDGSPASTRMEVERSLRRLDTDVIDLIQLHTPDPVRSMAETMGGLLELRREGKVREIGVSNVSLVQLQEAVASLGDVALASNQPQYSLLVRDVEEEILPFAIELDVGILAYAALDQGLLSGKVRDERTFRAGEGRPKRVSYQAENRALVNGLLDRVVAPIAEQHRVTIAQVVLAWTVAQPGVTSLLVGGRDERQVMENAAAAEVSLSDDELTSIDVAFRGVQLKQPRRSIAQRLKSALRRVTGRRG